MEAFTRSSRLGRWNRFKSRITANYRGLTRDFNYTADFFFGLKFLLAISGARLDSQNGKIRRGWNIYRMMMWYPLIVILWNTYVSIHRRAKLEIILSCLQAVIGTVISTIRMLIILCHYEPLMDVRRYINRQFFGRNLDSSLGIRSEAFHNIRRRVIPAVLIIICLISSYLAIDLHNLHIFKMPFDISSEHPHIQKFCEKLCSLTLIGLGMMTVSIYLIVYMILNGLTSELKVLTESFALILDSTAKRVERKMYTKSGNSNQLNLLQRHYFWKFIHEEFCNCIMQNIEFLALLEKIRPLLNASFLIVYYAAVLNLASGAIYLSQVKSLTMFTFVTVYFCLWTAFECASLTRAVSALTDVNESIGTAIYSLDWPTQLVWEDRFKEEYRAVRQTMLNVMAVAQQPLRLNCFGFFEFTQDRFYELLNMAYSVYTFFRDFV